MKKIYTLIKYYSMIEKELIYGGHLLSLGASSVIISINLLLNLHLNIILAFIPYLSTQIVYSYNHFREINFDLISNPERARYIQKQKRWMGNFLLIYTIILIILLLFTNLRTILFVLFIVLSGILYTDYFKEQISKLIIGWKNFYSAIFWALQIFLVPFFYNIRINLFFLFFFLIIFLTAFINSTFFDIKDIESDRDRSIKTFPVTLGIKKTIYLLFILKLSTFIPILIGISKNYLPKEALFFIIFIVYGLYYLSQALFSNGKNLRKISYTVADGEYCLWSIVLLIVKIIYRS